MHVPEQIEHPCDRQLRAWHLRRELVNLYHGAVRALPSEGRDALQQRRELNAKLAAALKELAQASGQLRRCEHEQHR